MICRSGKSLVSITHTRVDCGGFEVVLKIEFHSRRGCLAELYIRALEFSAATSTGTYGVGLELWSFSSYVSASYVLFLIQSFISSAASFDINFFFFLWGHNVRDDLLTTEFKGLEGI